MVADHIDGNAPAADTIPDRAVRHRRQNRFICKGVNGFENYNLPKTFRNLDSSRMADDKPSLSIDNDWKKQAQEEKRKLVEEQQKKAAAAAAAPAQEALGDPRAGAGTRGRRELPPVNFGTMVQSIMTQALFYLGDLSPEGGEPMLNLDRAKNQIDTLTLLEQKTVNNLTPEESHMLDAALYEVRMRYVNVASQYI